MTAALTFCLKSQLERYAVFGPHPDAVRRCHQLISSLVIAAPGHRPNWKAYNPRHYKHYESNSRTNHLAAAGVVCVAALKAEREDEWDRHDAGERSQVLWRKELCDLLGFQDKKVHQIQRCSQLELSNLHASRKPPHAAANACWDLQQKFSRNVRTMLPD